MTAMESMLDMPQTAVRHFVTCSSNSLEKKADWICASIKYCRIVQVELFFTDADLCHKFTQNLVEKKQVRAAMGS